MTVVLSSMPSSIRPMFATMNDRCYVALGHTRVKCIQNDGTTLSSRDAGLIAPTFSLTAIGSGSSILTSGVYTYYHCLYNPTDGWESDYGPLASASITDSQGIYLTGILPSHSESAATAVRIYRSKVGGATGYYLTQVNNGTTTYYDQTADINLGTDTYPTVNGVPPATKYIRAHQRRLWFAGVDLYSAGTVTLSSNTTILGSSTGWSNGIRGRYFQADGDSKIYSIASWDSATQLTLTTDYSNLTTGAGKAYYIYGEPNYVYYSEIGANDVPQPEYVPLGLTVANYVDFNTNDGHVVNGLGDSRSNTLLVFKDNQVWALSGNTKSTFSKNLVNPFGGCASAWTIANDASGACIYFSGDSVMMTDGVNFTSLSENKIDDFLKYYTNTNNKYLSHGLFYPKRNQYLLWVPSLFASSTPDICLIYDIATKDWFIRAIPAVCSWLVYNDTTKEFDVYIGTADGFVFKLDQDGVYNNGAPSGTVSGTTTSSGNTSLTDTAATYNTTDDGNKGCYVSIISGVGAGQDRLISSNNGNTLTITPAWTVNPSSATYAIGASRAYYYSKWIDMGAPDMYKKLYTFFATYLNEPSATNVTFDFFTDFTYEVGTVTVTNGSASVVGSGTKYTTADIGKPIRFAGHGLEYIVSNVTDSSNITLNKTFQGTTSSATRYILPRISTTADFSNGVTKIMNMACRARVFQFRIGLCAVNKKFSIYNIGYSLNAESDVGL